MGYKMSQTLQQFEGFLREVIDSAAEIAAKMVLLRSLQFLCQG